MLGVKNDGFAPGQMSQVELNLRTPPPGTSAGRISVPSWFPQGTSGGAATSPLSDQGAEWLKGREKNSVIMTPDIARRQYSITQFDDASKTYIDSSGHRTFGYGHVLTDADARDGLTVASLSQMTPAEKQDLADRLFTQDVQTHFNNVAARLGQATISQLRPNQVDALIGDDFNAGSNAALGTNMIQAIRRGDDQGRCRRVQRLAHHRPAWTPHAPAWPRSPKPGRASDLDEWRLSPGPRLRSQGRGNRGAGRPAAPTTVTYA
ncbi:MAG TPA: hypothetical protein VGL66_06455 [Caulobacteraceae bacterium]|jgi:GH24 family phage-related lysozyme (muramidase)